MVDAASEKPDGLYDSHSADDTMGSLKHRLLAPEIRKSTLADGSVTSSSRTKHWLPADVASHATWASACVT